MSARAARSWWILIASACMAGCAVMAPDPGPLAHSQVAPDFATYDIVRVGLLPFQGPGVTERDDATLQQAFQLELSRVMPYELVPLSPRDLAEVLASDPYRRGCYEPRTILEIAKRFRLDALLVGTVTQFEPYPPQALGLQIDLVASETGLAVWGSSVNLDAGDARARARMEHWQSTQKADGGNRESLQLSLVSPERFARFAAWEVASSARISEIPSHGTRMARRQVD